MTETPERSSETRRRRPLAGIPPRVWAIGVITVLAFWFVFANLNQVAIQFWLYTVTAPLWIALLTALVAGVVLGWLLKGRWRRERRRKA